MHAASLAYMGVVMALENLKSRMCVVAEEKAKLDGGKIRTAYKATLNFQHRFSTEVSAEEKPASLTSMSSLHFECIWPAILVRLRSRPQSILNSKLGSVEAKTPFDSPNLKASLELKTVGYNI